MLWEKFVTLVAFSGVTCLTRRPIGVVFDHPESVAFLRRLVAENLSVAAAAGHDFAADRAEFLSRFFQGLPGCDQVVDAGRPRGRPAPRDAVAFRTGP